MNLFRFTVFTKLKESQVNIGYTLRYDRMAECSGSDFFSSLYCYTIFSLRRSLSTEPSIASKIDSDQLYFTLVTNRSYPTQITQFETKFCTVVPVRLMLVTRRCSTQEESHVNCTEQTQWTFEGANPIAELVDYVMSKQKAM